MTVITVIKDTTIPRWTAMWLLAAGLFAAGKAIALINTRLKPQGWRLAAFSLLWVGMNAKEWSVGGSKSAASGRMLLMATAKMVFGGVLLWIVARHFTQPLAAAWCGMAGLIFFLHFGLFDALAIFWRRLSVPVTSIMDCPIAAISLAEFWGRRWNLAFRDLAHLFVFRPVARRFGLNAALWASFSFSGLAHELVISVPADAGYGLPTGYFMLQATGITLERRLFPNATTSGSHVPRWLFTHAFTALPAFILFHPPFVERVMIPFFHAIGALP